MEVLFFALELASIALGAGSAFIFSSFFILSLKDHKIEDHEYVSLKRLSTISLISAYLGLGLYIVNTAIFFETATDFDLGRISAKICIFALALISELTLRKIHLPTLMRHQTSYFHLSDKMMHHEDPLINTSVFNLVSWIFIILITSAEYNDFNAQFNYGFVEIVFCYILITYIFGKIAIAWKEHNFS